MKIKELLIDWKGTTEDFKQSIDGEHTVNSLTPGVEADVFSVGFEETPRYVLKRWKSQFPHKSKDQFEFLNIAFSVNLPVTRPVGWGNDISGREILATDFGGTPIHKPSLGHLETFAITLANIHNSNFSHYSLRQPKNNRAFIGELFVSQFPGLKKYPDIYRISEELTASIPEGQLTLLHGDYNLGNVLLKDNRLAVIDWSDARIGDYRYDLAWASFLLWIYGNDTNQIFLDSYLKSRNIKLIPKEYRFFELLAGLRWILIRRQYPVGGDLEKACKFFNQQLLEAGIGRDLLLN